MPEPGPPTFRQLIAGRWVESTSGETFESVNPADNRDVVGRVRRLLRPPAAGTDRQPADVGGSRGRPDAEPRPSRVRGDLRYPSAGPGP